MKMKNGLQGYLMNIIQFSMQKEYNIFIENIKIQLHQIKQLKII